MTAIVGGQALPGSIQIDSKVNTTRVNGQGYTVPSNGYIEVQMWSNSTSGYWEIDGNNLDAVYSVAQGGDSGKNVPTFRWGPGTSIIYRSSGTGFIKGVFYTNS